MPTEQQLALLISTYDLGHQPFALASPAAWLVAAGARVACNDLAVEPLDEAAVRTARLIAVHLPMHTATRLAGELTPRLKALNPKAQLCFFGLYAPMNEDYLRSLGGDSVLGAEFEAALVATYRAATTGEALPQPGNLDKLAFLTPDRVGLPGLEHYAKLRLPDGSERLSGYTEASRGCKHRCRHCPVVPVYDGRFRVIERDVVLADVRQQVAAGARHISFGDPDFLNGPGHALALIEDLHAEFPGLTYDVTIKVEHLLRHEAALPKLRRTGCLFVISAIESFEDGVLERLDKGHTRAQALAAVELLRGGGLDLSPTFVPFTPWTTLEGYRGLLSDIVALDLVAAVAPVQLALRLLVPAGSLILELDDWPRFAGAYDAENLTYAWRNPDPAVDTLQGEIMALVADGETAGEERHSLFGRLWRRVHESLGETAPPLPPGRTGAVPSLSEGWYCCAEPSENLMRAAQI